MLQILLAIEILIAIALVAVILLQRSEGGALGIGGGGGGGLMSARGAANLLTRLTTILAIAFIGIALALANLAGKRGEGESVFDQPGQNPPANTGADPTLDDLPSLPDPDEADDSSLPTFEDAPAPDEDGSDENG